jgi:signal transduction histidine kinase
VPLEGNTALDADGGNDSAVAALLEVSSYLAADVEAPAFFGRLSASIAEHTGAGRAAFWRLGPRGTLSVQPGTAGFEDHPHLQEVRVHLGARGEGAIERLLFGDELDVMQGTAPELDAVWRAAGLHEIASSLAAPWRAGDRRFGMVAVYDSTRGFTARDLSLLRMAGSVAGLLWQFRESERELGRTAARLEEAVSARRHLLNNIAAGGDEARRRFASALHDDSLQLLTGAELQLERIRADAKGSRHASNLDQLRSTLRKVEDSLRRLLINVSPDPLQPPKDLNDAIRERLESMRIGAGIEPHVVSRLPGNLAPAIKAIALKNIAEALTNVEKHARATRVTVVTEGVDRGLRVEVRDDGKGFVVAESVRLPGHIGLLALTERVQLAGGWCRIQSEPGAGTKVEFWMPLTL